VPGLVDLHVHFMPDQVLRKVWAYFDNIPPTFGAAWPIEYRIDQEARIERLHELGVIAHTALLYPHKSGMAAWLNGWGLEFARGVPGCVPTATFYPEPGVSDYVREALQQGARVFKAHLQVGDYDPRDPLLDDVWGMLAEAGAPIVCHCGSGPMPGRFTGPGPIGEVLARHPRLTLVVAHTGQPEYAEFLDLAAAYEGVHLDTTMTFTDYIEARAPFPPALKPRLLDLGDRIVLGSDFPNIPYPYAHQLAVLDRLDLGDAWLRAVLHDNGERLLRTSLPAAS
jgi:cytosine/adenosine deaminase-related metal-dependent hydrolase